MLALISAETPEVIPFAFYTSEATTEPEHVRFIRRSAKWRCCFKARGYEFKIPVIAV